MGAAGNRLGRSKGTLRKSPLTGLLFPQGFMEEARWFIQGIKPNAYCMIAIDVLHFRLFNKFHGRDMGDRFLRHIANAMETLRKEHGGVSGYFEGDNFCLIMPFRLDLIQHLWDEIMAGVTNQGSALGVLPVFGVSPIDDPDLPPEIFHDRATLARSRAAARDPISCYNPGMESYLEEEMRLLMEVTEALERDEFTFFAQPQCDIFSGKLVGAESLVRWRHPDRGLIPPGKFLPVLERSGMIHLLDRQVWERVCQWLRSWMDRGYHPVPISINISRIDIMSMDVPAYLGYLLKKYDLPPKYIKAEITESAYAEEDDTINSTVDRLREAGLLVMMDDFGSGYSSLNMLKSISVDVLKLDMRFLEIGEGEEQKGIGILESIVNMARLMGLPIIVEGVENLQQENVLRSMGCQYVQGYYYCKPLPIDQFELILADERRLGFGGRHCGHDKPGKEIPIGKTFAWAGRMWHIPAVYSCGKGLVMDVCVEIEPDALRAFLEKWWPNGQEGREWTAEELEQQDAENPMTISYQPTLTVNGKPQRRRSGSGFGWVPDACRPVEERGQRNQQDWEAAWLMEHYGLNQEKGWTFFRESFPWITKTRLALKSLSLSLEQSPVSVPGPRFTVSEAGDSIPFTNPVTGEAHTLTVVEYEAQQMDAAHFQDKDQWEYPTHYTAMSFVVEPELPQQSLTVRDCGQGDRPRPKQSNLAGPTVASSVGVILATNKSGQPRAACSSLYFDPPERIEWRMVFYQKTAEDVEIDLPLSQN